MASTGISWRHVPRWAHAAGKAIDGATGVIVVTAPIAIGGMLPWAQALWSLAAIVVLAAAAGVHGATGARWRWEATTVVLFVLAALSLLRATPLFAFNSGDLEQDVFALWSHVDPSGTVAPGRAPLAALRLLGLASIFQLASVRFRGRDGSARSARIALGACGLTIVIGVLHGALGLGEIYGFYEPEHLAGVRVPLAAPYVNENQAGAMWGLAAVLLVGVAVYDTKRRVFAMIGAAAAIICTEFILRSHGGAVAAVAASIMMVVGINLPEMKSRVYGRLLGGAGSLVLFCCAVVAWLIAPRFGNESVTLEKASIWQDSLIPALSKPLGFGPGAYGDMFGAYAGQPWNTRFAFVESAPIQVAVDHGAIAAFVLLACLGSIFWRRMRFDAREERDLRAVTLGLVTYIGVEAITGMGLEGIGYAFPVALLAGMTAGRSIERSKQNASRASVVLGSTALIALTLLSLDGLPQSIRVGDDHVGDILSGVASDQGRESEAMQETMRELARAVPADTMLLTHALAASLRDDDIDRAEQISTVLKVLAPGRPVTWDFAVDVHMAQADSVGACAAVHQMVAVGGEGSRVVSSLQRITDNPMDWQQCVEHPDSLDFIYEGLHASRRTDDALAIAIRELRRNPGHAGSQRAAFRGYLAMDLPAQTVEIGLGLLEENPGDREVVVHTSQQLVRLERYAEALTILDRARATDRSNVGLRLERLAVLFQWEQAPNRVAEFEQEYQQLLAYTSRNQGTALRRLRLGAAFFVQQERWIEAENAFRGILRLNPQDAGALHGLETSHRGAVSEAACVRHWARWAWRRLNGLDAALPSCELPVELACAQRLEGLLFAALRAAGDPRQVHFAATAREIVGSNLLRPLALRPVLDALSSAGVKALLYKGAATTQMFPILRGVRGVADADLLVSPQDFALARQVLIDLGLRESIDGEPLSYWSNNERVFVGGNPELQIDLHRGLHRRPLFGRLTRHALASAELENGIWYPNVATVPLLVAAHRAKHGYTADARELMDVTCAFAKLDDDEFSKLCDEGLQLGVGGALYGLWSLVRTWFGPTNDAETAAFVDLGDRLGWRRQAVDSLVALDAPFDANKPWLGRGFVKLYAPHPVLGRGWIAPAALLAAHVVLRSADRAVGIAGAVAGTSR